MTPSDRFRVASLTSLVLVLLQQITSAQTQSNPEPQPQDGIVDRSISYSATDNELAELESVTLTESEVRKFSERLLEHHLGNIGARRINLLPRSQRGIYIKDVIEPVFPLLKQRAYARMRATLINSQVPGVFVLPDGRLFATERMLTLTKTQDALFGLLAHELSHLHRGHVLQIPRLLKLRGVGLESLDEQDFAKFVSQPYTAEQELQADRDMIQWMFQCHHIPSRVVDFLEMQVEEEALAARLNLRKTVPVKHISASERLPNLRGEIAIAEKQRSAKR